MEIKPSGAALGASVEDLDLSRPLSAAEDKTVVDALGKYGVLRFPGQKLDAAQLKRFAAIFGDLEINVASGAYQEPGHPEVMILSNIVENGRPIGLAIPTCRTARPSRSPMCSTASRSRAATAGRWATPSSAACTLPMKASRKK
jgi:alpha-ketoglutarate-dependent taurine dioxygenase